MRHFGDHGAEGDHHGHVEMVDNLHDCIGERAPQKMGLDALHEHQIAVLIGEQETVDAVLRPIDDAVAAVGDAGFGSSLAEVEEWVGVYRTQRDRVVKSERLNCTGRRAADVEEAFERGDENWRSQWARGLIVPDKGVHQASMPHRDLIPVVGLPIERSGTG